MGWRTFCSNLKISCVNSARAASGDDAAVSVIAEDRDTRAIFSSRQVEGHDTVHEEEFRGEAVPKLSRMV